MENTTKRKNSQILKSLSRLYLRMWKESPGIKTTKLILSLSQGLSYGVVPFSVKYVLEEVSRSIELGALTQEFPRALIVFMIIQCLSIFINGMTNGYYCMEDIPIKNVLSTELFRKAESLSLYSFEDTERLNDLDAAVTGIDAVDHLHFNFTTIMAFYLPVIISFSILFISVNPLLLLIIPMIIIPSLIIEKLRVGIYKEVAKESGPISRQRDEYRNAAIDQKNFKESRLLGVVSFFLGLFEDRSDRLQNLELDAERTLFRKENIMRIINVAAYILIMLLLVVLLLSRAIDIPAFIAVLTSLGELYGVLEEVIFRNLTALSTKIGYAGIYLNYLDIEENTGDGDRELTLDDAIRAEHLTFSYPSTDRKAIDDLSFSIRRGEKVALVGENGSGKTTLSKVLLGMYPQYDGSLKFDGIEVKEQGSRERTKVSSAVFQDFVRYKLPLIDNVTLSDEGDPDRVKAEVSLKRFNLMPEKLEKGLDTVLSSEFGGRDLSKGQWQSVALARAWYRERDFLVLDEPTSAIDPEKESMIYDSLNGMIEGKTALIVTHRMGLTKIVDRILVLKDGKLIEEGSHEDLMARDTHYRKMYESQLKWYADNVRNEKM